MATVITIWEKESLVPATGRRAGYQDLKQLSALKTNFKTWLYDSRYQWFPALQKTRNDVYLSGD